MVFLSFFLSFAGKTDKGERALCILEFGSMREGVVSFGRASASGAEGKRGSRRSERLRSERETVGWSQDGMEGEWRANGGRDM